MAFFLRGKAAAAPRPMRVFLSYARADQDFALRLRRSIEATGDVEVFQDVDRIELGEKWWSRVVELITGSDRVVFVLSKASAASLVCREELAEAERQGKVIFPLLIGGISWDAVPPQASPIHGLSVESSAPAYEELAFAKLRTSLKKNFLWVRQQTRYQELAKDWEANGRRAASLLRGQALLQARHWLKVPPPTGETRSSLVDSYIAESTAAQTRRRGGAFVAAFLIFAILAGTGFTALFYRSDANLNLIRTALRAGAIDDVQRNFLGWASSTGRSLLPEPASATTLASEILDYGLVAHRPTFRLEIEAGEHVGEWRSSSVHLESFADSVFALYEILPPNWWQIEESQVAPAGLLLRCSSSGDACQQQRISLSEGRALSLVADATNVYLLDYSPSQINSSDIIIYEITTEGELVVQQSSGLDLPIKIDESSGTLNWVTSGFEFHYSRDDSTNRQISKSPPLFLVESEDEVSKTAIYAGEWGVLEADCDWVTATTCALKVASDARANAYHYELWKYYSQEDFAAEGDGWRSINAGFFSTGLVDSTFSMSKDGRIIAVSRDNYVHLWQSDNVARGFDQIWKTFDITESVEGLEFSADSTQLYLATSAGITTVMLYPRLLAAHSASQFQKNQISDSVEVYSEPLMNGLIMTSSDDGCTIRFAAAKATIDVKEYNVANCENGAWGGVLAESNHASVVAVYASSFEERILTTLFVEQIDGRPVVKEIDLPNSLIDLNMISSSINRSRSLSKYGFLGSKNQLITFTLDEYGVSTQEIGYSPDVTDLIRQGSMLEHGLSGLLRLVQVSPDSIVGVVGNSECASDSPGPGGADLVLMSVRDKTMEIIARVACVDGFSSYEDSNAQDGVVANANCGSVFIGAYHFDGILEWNLASSSLSLHRAEGERATVAEITISDEGKVDHLPAGKRLGLGLSMTHGALSDTCERLAFFSKRGGSLGSSHVVQLYDLNKGHINAVGPSSVGTFDYVHEVALSPNGKVLLVAKEESGLFLFDLGSGRQVEMLNSALSATFIADDLLKVEFELGSYSCWIVPEGADSIVNVLLERMRGILGDDGCRADGLLTNSSG